MEDHEFLSSPARVRPSRSKLFIASTLAAIVLLILFVLLDLLLPVAKTSTYQYDERGRITRRNTPRGRAIKYRYNNAGLLTEVAYHRIGAITKQAYPASDSVSFD